MSNRWIQQSDSPCFSDRKCKAHTWLAYLMALMIALLSSTPVSFGQTTADSPTSSSLVAAKTECPANYDRGSAACKKARAEGTCPERQGGKCLAKKR
ncbi:MAG: hypothetical protein KatS3mg130_0238 [Candidatus Sumerlaea sp.]|nr:MAG: hypothetical protein KatS3mg130_0238 [Candidatus Sumerlaea sp.]